MPQRVGRKEKLAEKVERRDIYPPVPPLSIKSNKNRRKAIFNGAAKGLFFLRGGGGYTHSGYHKTLSATIACNRTSCETET